LGITKAYTTRVGEGPFVTEETGEFGERLRTAGSEFGATTGRPRRCGWLDVVMLRESATVNGLTGLAVNKLDIFSGIGDLRIATAYRVDGKISEAFPMTLAELERAEPVYETLAGWDEDVRECRRYEDLPENARAYVDRIEALVDVPVDIISVGPGRNETITRNDPFRPL
jgi:adenylosuccinate synthase